MESVVSFGTCVVQNLFDGILAFLNNLLEFFGIQIRGSVISG
ncbi:MAG: hypothetical protein R6V12_04785 [Candidatus Hydrogenedentota bacterium]